MGFFLIEENAHLLQNKYAKLETSPFTREFKNNMLYFLVEL